MILHLAEKEFEGVYEKFCYSENIFIDFLEISNDVKLLNLLKSNRNLPNYRHIVFQFRSNLHKEVLEAVKYLHTFFNINIIIMAAKSTSSNRLFSDISSMGIRNCIDFDENQQNDEEYLKALKEAMSPEGINYSNVLKHRTSANIETIRAKIKPTLVIPTGYTFHCFIGGTQRRTGTTTQCFMLYHALKALGFNPCIVDETQTFIQNIMQLHEEECEISGSIVKVKGVNFSNSIQINDDYNAFITDIGDANSLENDPKNKSFYFITSGSKAWEFPYLANLLSKQSNIKWNILFSFTPKEEEKDLKELIGNVADISFVGYNPSLWTNNEVEIYNDFLIPMIENEIQND